MKSEDQLNNPIPNTRAPSLLEQCQELLPATPWVPLPNGDELEEIVRCEHVIVRKLDSPLGVMATIPSRIERGIDAQDALRRIREEALRTLLSCSPPMPQMQTIVQEEGVDPSALVGCYVRHAEPAGELQPNSIRLVLDQLPRDPHAESLLDQADARILAKDTDKLFVLARYARRLKGELDDALAQVHELRERLGMIGDDPSKPVMDAIKARVRGENHYAGAHSYQDAIVARAVAHGGLLCWKGKYLMSDESFGEDGVTFDLHLNVNCYPEGTVILVSIPAEEQETPKLDLGLEEG